MIRRLGLSLAWIAAALLLGALGAVPASVMNERAADDRYRDAYYVIANWHYALSLAATCAVFALVYVFLRPVSAFQQRLAWAHFCLFCVGYALIIGPSWVLPLHAMLNRYGDVSNVFQWANWIPSVGYAFTLLGLLIFLWLMFHLTARALASRLRPRSV